MSGDFTALRVATTAVVLAATLHASSAAAAKTYFIDEGTDFTGNGCEITDVNTITASLQTSLSAASWTGSRYVNASAYPQDFWESCSSVYGSGGLDGSYGDTGFLSVYAGHGSAHYIAFGYPHSSQCGVDFSTNARLGAMNGASAGFGMWLACEVVQSSQLTSAMYQRLSQQAGWQNSIGIGDDEPRDFFNATSTKTNADAWIDQMSTGGRDAIIATFSNTSAECWPKHNSAKLKANVGNTTLGGGASCGGGQPRYYVCYEHHTG